MYVNFIITEIICQWFICEQSMKSKWPKKLFLEDLKEGQHEERDLYLVFVHLQELNWVSFGE